MMHSEFAAAALLKARATGAKPTPDPAPAEAPLSGASFLELEPDLAKEAGLRTREMSGWAAGGSSVTE